MKLHLIRIGLVFLAIGMIQCDSRKDTWTKEIRYTGTNSSPRPVDLNNDGVLDIVMGAGGEEFDTTSYAVIALDGKDGSILWYVPGHNQMVGSAVFKDITGDHVPDVFIGGRSAQFYAINGATGQILWQYLPEDYNLDNVKTDSSLLNFFNPQFIPDQNGDGLEDLLTTFGGLVQAPPDEMTRPPGRIIVLDTKQGHILKDEPAPDGKEIYTSPLVYDFGEGLSIVFGTGGETIPGNLYLLSIRDLFESGMDNVRLVDSSLNKGFIAPPIIIDITLDNLKDLVYTRMDGTMSALDGKDFSKIWSTQIHPNCEVESMPAPLYFDEDSIPDFFGSYNIGTWPKNDTTIHAILSGKTGEELFRDTLGILQFSSPIVLDYNEDSYGDIIYHTNVKFHTGLYYLYKNQLVIYDGRTGKRTGLDSVKYGKNLGSTPLVTDLDNDNKADVVYAFMNQNDQLITYKHLIIKRLELDVSPGDNPWGSYMGTNYSGVYSD